MAGIEIVDYSGMVANQRLHTPERTFLTAADIIPNPATLRKGDQVHIAVGRRVVRVGYRKLPADYRDAVLERLKEDPGALGRLENLLRFKIRGRQHRKLVDALCYAAARADGFGGPDRGVMVEEAVHLVGEGYTSVVRETRHARVGRYYPPTGRMSMWEDAYEPGGLSDAKTIVLVSLEDAWGEFLACDLLKVVPDGRP